MVFSPFHSNNNVSVTIYFQFLFKKNFLFFSIFSNTKFPPSLIIQYWYMYVAFSKGHVYSTKDLCCLKTPFYYFTVIWMDFVYSSFISVFIVISFQNTHFEMLIFIDYQLILRKTMEINDVYFSNHFILSYQPNSNDDDE